MIKVGNYVMDMGDYLHLSGLILTEALKYLAVLLFSILAIRLWRRMPKLSPQNRRSNFIFAAMSTILACGIGYFSLRQSMGRFYAYYGMRAFNSSYMNSAFSLFAKSNQNWKSADAVGGEAVSLFWIDQTNAGAHLLNEAQMMRPNKKNSTFENFYAGLYYFFNNQTDEALPLLEAAATDPHYYSTVAILLAVVKLDKNYPDQAEELMKPFRQYPVADVDEAYVIASLDLIEGKKSAAAALWKDFYSTNLPPFWKSRFDNLGEKIQH